VGRSRAQQAGLGSTTSRLPQARVQLPPPLALQQQQQRQLKFLQNLSPDIMIDQLSWQGRPPGVVHCPLIGGGAQQYPAAASFGQASPQQQAGDGRKRSLLVPQQQPRRGTAAPNVPEAAAAAGSAAADPVNPELWMMLTEHATEYSHPEWHLHPAQVELDIWRTRCCLQEGGVCHWAPCHRPHQTWQGAAAASAQQSAAGQALPTLYANQQPSFLSQQVSLNWQQQELMQQKPAAQHGQQQQLLTGGLPSQLVQQLQQRSSVGVGSLSPAPSLQPVHSTGGALV